jgi:hypothetical protein
MTADELRRSWKLERRADALVNIKYNQPFWVIKNPEAQVVLQDISDIFGKVYFIHIIMDGRKVVASSMERGWFRNSYNPIDDYKHKTGFEWLDEEDRLNWQTWNPETRAACVWRTLTKRGMNYSRGKNNCFQFQYESFVKSPEEYVRAIQSSISNRLRLTPLTHTHIKSVEAFKSKITPVVFNVIQQPERAKFTELMKELEYV